LVHLTKTTSKVVLWSDQSGHTVPDFQI